MDTHKKLFSFEIKALRLVGVCETPRRVFHPPIFQRFGFVLVIVFSDCIQVSGEGSI